MFDAMTEGMRAVATVGVVFAEAIALYVGYGAITRVASSTVLDAIVGERP